MIFYRNQELPLAGNNGACPWRKRVYSLACWAWIVMFFCLTGCETMARNQKQADAHMEIGTAYIQSGKYNSALKELMQAEELGKSNPKIHYLLGVAYHRKGLNELAIGEMKKAIDLDSNYSEAYNYLGAIYIDVEKWDPAIESFEKALANILYDTPAVAHFNMGWAYYKKGNYDAALQQYALALAQGPDTIDVPLIEKNRGIVLLASGRTAEALKHLQKSVELAPFQAESYYWMGQCFIEQKNTEKAKAAFQEAVKLAPDTEWGQKSRKKIEALSLER